MVHVNTHGKWQFANAELTVKYENLYGKNRDAKLNLKLETCMWMSLYYTQDTGLNIICVPSLLNVWLSNKIKISK